MKARTRAELEPLDHYIYIVWRDDQPVYVGMTCDYDQRLRQWGVLSPGGRKFYRSTVTHVDVWEVGPGREHAEAIERETITALDPQYNRQHSPRVEEDRQRWTEYSEWAHAYRLAMFMPAYEWALDQATADRVCAAVGYTAPNCQAAYDAEREYLRRVVNAIGLPEQAAS